MPSYKVLRGRHTQYATTKGNSAADTDNVGQLAPSATYSANDVFWSYRDLATRFDPHGEKFELQGTSTYQFGVDPYTGDLEDDADDQGLSQMTEQQVYDLGETLGVDMSSFTVPSSDPANQKSMADAIAAAVD